MKDTIIFDLDGTLLDTLDDLADSVNYSLKINGYPERTIEEVRRFVGNGIGKLIKRAVPEGTSKENTDKVFNEFREYYGENCRVKTKPYDGIMDLIESLSKKGYKLAIVSNKVDFAVKELRDIFFKEYIDVAIGESEGIRRKPHSDMVNKALEELKSIKDNCYYIGDSDVDIMTARNSGMKCICVTWGFRDKDFLLENGGSTFIDTPLQLLDILADEGYTE